MNQQRLMQKEISHYAKGKNVGDKVRENSYMKFHFILP